LSPNTGATQKTTFATLEKEAGTSLVPKRQTAVGTGNNSVQYILTPVPLDPILGEILVT
jgi:hypothetical protein